VQTARDSGLYNVSASGTQYLGYAVSLLLDLFGEQWLSTGVITAKFIAVVTVNDTIQAKARVTEVRSAREHCQVRLDVWCENQAGAKVMVASATGLVV
jgi:acyl dehydratase